MKDLHIMPIRILGKHYNIRCPAEQAESLKKSALIIDEKLQGMKQASGTSSTDRMLVVTALNLCHELLLLKNENSEYINKIENKLQELQNRIQSVLSTEEECVI